MVVLFKNISEFNHIRFSAYRTAMKLRKIQKALHCKSLIYLEVFYLIKRISIVQHLSMNAAIEAFDSHGLCGQNDKILDVGDMITVLSSIFSAIPKSQTVSLNIPLVTDLTINWLLNIYDWWVNFRHQYNTL